MDTYKQQLRITPGACFMRWNSVASRVEEVTLVSHSSFFCFEYLWIHPFVESGKKQAPEPSLSTTVQSQVLRGVWIQGFEYTPSEVTFQILIFPPQCMPRFLKLVLTMYTSVSKLFSTWLSIIKYRCYHVYTHWKRKAQDSSVYLTSHSSFAQGGLTDQHPGLGMRVGKNNRHHLFSHFYCEKHFENVPLFLFVSMCKQVISSQTVCLKDGVQRMLLLGLLGKSVSCGWDHFVSQSGEAKRELVCK